MTSDQQYVEELEKRLQKKIVIRPREGQHVEEFEITAMPPKRGET